MILTGWVITDRAIEVLEAPVNARVWRVLVQKDEKLRAKQVVVVLEAMKMEINVNADPHLEGCVVEEVFVQPGDTVESGRALIAARTVSPDS